MEFLVGSFALFVLSVQTASESSGWEVFAGVPYSCKLDRDFYVFISCLAAKANFRPLTRWQSHSPNVSHWPFLFSSYSFSLLKVTRSLVMRLGPKAWLRESVWLKPGTFQSRVDTLFHFATISYIVSIVKATSWSHDSFYEVSFFWSCTLSL